MPMADPSLPTLPSGYSWDTSTPASTPLSPQLPNLPAGYAWDYPGAPPSGLGAQTLTGLQRGTEYALGIPRALATAAQNVWQGTGLGSQPGIGQAVSSGLDWATRQFHTPQEWSDALYRGGVAQNLNQALGLPQPQPAPATTPGERIYQAGLSAVLPTLLGNYAGISAPLVPSVVGSGTAQAYAEARPDDYAGQLAAATLASLATGKAMDIGGNLAGQAGQFANRVASPQTVAGQQAAQELVTIAGQPADVLTQRLTLPPNAKWKPNIDTGTATGIPALEPQAYAANPLLQPDQGGVMSTIMGKVPRVAGMMAGGALEHVAGAFGMPEIPFVPRGFIGAALGGQAEKGIENLLGGRIDQFNDALSQLRTRVASDPAFARSLLMQYPTQLPMSTPPNYLNYLTGRFPAMVTIGGQGGGQASP